MILWPALSQPIQALWESIKRALSHRKYGNLSNMHNSDGSNPLLQARSRSRNTLYALIALLPDCMGISVVVDRGQLFVPCLRDDSEKPRSQGIDSETLAYNGLSRDMTGAPVLRTRAS